MVDWSVKRARSALSASLRRLGRERIDLYLWHEPDLRLIATDEWLRWLEDERARVAWFGVAETASAWERLSNAPIRWPPWFRRTTASQAAKPTF